MVKQLIRLPILIFLVYNQNDSRSGILINIVLITFSDFEYHLRLMHLVLLYSVVQRKWIVSDIFFKPMQLQDFKTGICGQMSRLLEVLIQHS